MNAGLHLKRQRQRRERPRVHLEEPLVDIVARVLSADRARAAKIPQESERCLTQALERLVQLYESLGRTDEAAKWRTELKAVQKQLQK